MSPRRSSLRLSSFTLRVLLVFRARTACAGVLTLSLATTGVLAAVPDTVRLESLAAVLEFAERHDPMLRALAADERAITASRSGHRSLPNPELSASSKHGGGERFGENAELELHVNVGRILSTPWRFREADARARAARERLEEARAARRFEVASAWYHAMAAQAVSDLEAAAASTWAAEAELARRRRGAGTMNALDLAETEAAAAQAHIAARRAARDALAARAVLAGALGLQDTGAGPVPLHVASALPPPDTNVVSAPPGARAGQSAPSVRAARAEAEAARRSLQVARVAVLPRLTAGATWERDGRGTTSLAPEVGVEVPLFNLGLSRRAGARAASEAATQRAAAHEASFAARLDALDASLAGAREAYAAWNDTVLPLRRRAAAEALLHYNYMLVGADRLLAARREELAAEHARVEAARDYWIARAARESLLGIAPAGPVARGPSTAPGVPHAPPPPSPSSSPAPDHTHDPAQVPHAH